MTAHDHYDVAIIGSGAGGGTMAHALADTGARILVIERGGTVPQEAENWDPAAVWRDLRYRTDERWVDRDGRSFRPYMHYNVGGNTKFWGSVLYRLRRQDFEDTQHADGMSPAWPIGYDALAPYYDRAERLYHVHGDVGDDPTEPPRGPFPHRPVAHGRNMAALVEAIRAEGLHPSPLPLGLIDPGLPDGCRLCRTCNSYPCHIHRKSDAEVCCVEPIRRYPNVTVMTGALAWQLDTDGPGTRVTSATIRTSSAPARVTADLFVVSCGAANSAALLLRSTSARHPQGLANSSGLVGRRYMAHLSTMLEGVSRRWNDDEFQKTIAINDFYLAGPSTPYPLGQIQAQGRTHAVMAKAIGDTWNRSGVTFRWIPQWAYHQWVSRANDWLAMTEDLPRPDNRVTVTADGRVVLDYRPNNEAAHAELVARLRGLLERLGYWSPKVFAHSTGQQNTTHQCGTAVFGTDPRTSVLDTFCRSHDVENLFVVDASFFPSSAAVNPGLTIIAQALRVADHIKETELR